MRFVGALNVLRSSRRARGNCRRRRRRRRRRTRAGVPPATHHLFRCSRRILSSQADSLQAARNVSSRLKSRARPQVGLCSGLRDLACEHACALPASLHPSSPTILICPPRSMSGDGRPPLRPTNGVPWQAMGRRSSLLEPTLASAPLVCQARPADQVHIACDSGSRGQSGPAQSAPQRLKTLFPAPNNQCRLSPSAPG